MRIEYVNNRWLLSGVTLSRDRIRPGQIWAQADGSDRTVKVLYNMIHEEGVPLIQYIDSDQSANGYIYTKDLWSFQTRYCLVVDDIDDLLLLTGNDTTSKDELQ